MTFCEVFTKAEKENKGFRRLGECLEYHIVHWGEIPQILCFDEGTGEVGRARSFTAGEILEDDWEVVE